MTAAKATAAKTIGIRPPDIRTAEFNVEGTAPLVIHRFSAKTKAQMLTKMEVGKASSSKKNREAKDSDQTFAEARYVAPEGWDGFHAASVRNAMISACRLVGYKMTLAKMSVFCVAEGRDAKEPQIPLVRIIGQPERQDDMARVETGQPYVTIRARYWPWAAKITIRYDADQFTIEDVTNLLVRVGLQVGLGEGRPDSKNSAGMGWGTFEVK